MNKDKKMFFLLLFIPEKLKVLETLIIPYSD